MIALLRDWRFTVLAILLSVVILTMLSMAYSVVMRHVVVPDSFAYLPKESNLIVATGGLGDLWNGVEYHLGASIRAEGTEPGFISELVGGLSDPLDETLSDLDEFEERDLVTDVASLSHHGFDVSRGLLLGAQLSGEDTEQALEHAAYLAVVPLRENGRPAFLRFLSAFADSDVATHRCRSGNEPETLLVNDDPAILVSFPETGTAILSTAMSVGRACLLLQQSFAAGNLRHARGDDFIYAAASQHLKRQLLSGSGAIVLMRELPSKLSPVMQSSLALNFEAKRMIASLEIDFENNRARIVDELLAAPPRQIPWRHLFSSKTGGVLEFRDSALPRYIHLASLNEEFQKVAEDSFGGVLSYLDELEDVQNIVLAALGYTEGLPRLALGIWADEASLKALVAKLQRRLRDERDEAILRTAVERLSRQRNSGTGFGGDHPAVAWKELRSDVLCEDEPWFDRYALNAHGQLKVSMPLDSSVFRSTEYVERIGDELVYRIDPAVTKNDFTFRIDDLGACGCVETAGSYTEPTESTRRICETLSDGRYRLSAAVFDGALWLTFGSRDLEQILAHRVGGVDRFNLGIDGNRRLRKGGLYANIPELIEMGLLSGESDTRDFVERYLFDLRNHPDTRITFSSTNRGQRFRVAIDARKASLGAER